MAITRWIEESGGDLCLSIFRRLLEGFTHQTETEWFITFDYLDPTLYVTFRSLYQEDIFSGGKCKRVDGRDERVNLFDPIS